MSKKKVKFILLATTDGGEQASGVVFSDGSFWRTTPPEGKSSLLTSKDDLTREAWERRGWTVIELPQ